MVSKVDFGSSSSSFGSVEKKTRMSSRNSKEGIAKATGVYDPAAEEHESDEQTYHTSESRKQIGLVSAIFLIFNRMIVRLYMYYFDVASIPNI